VDLETLAARVRLLEDEQAVLRRLHAYGHALDYGDEAGWADCFTEDGVFEVRTGATVDRRIAGRADLHAFAGRHTRAPDLWHKHVVLDPVIAIEGDRASSVSVQFQLLHHGDGPIVRSFGRYFDRLERGADGAWRIRERIAEMESRTEGLPPFADGRHA
jgi:hypothetical protein